MLTPNIENALASPSIHTLTKDILKAAMGKDCVDAVCDIKLAYDLMRERLDIIQGRETEGIDDLADDPGEQVDDLADERGYLTF